MRQVSIYLVMAIVALSLSWLTISVSAANIFRASRPALALKFHPGDARALAKSAEEVLIRAAQARASGPSSVARAKAFAIEALKRDLTVIPAWRVLAMTSPDSQLAARLFTHSSELSQRDLPTRLWLIEERVQANDVEGALRHYDAALRTTTSSFDILFPILISATADDKLIVPLAKLLRTSPPWRHVFFDRLASGSLHADNLVRLIKEAGPYYSPQERDLVWVMIRRLIEQRDHYQALRLYEAVSGRTLRNRVTVSNGGFEEANDVPPFTWQLQDETGLSAVQQALGAAGSGSVLVLSSANGRGGVSARQLLLLSSGRYRLTARLGRAPDRRPGAIYWRFSCANEAQNLIAEANFPPLNQRTTASAVLEVAHDNCSAQWLEIGIRSDFGPGEAAGWIDDVNVTRIS